jgi:hypothetical protein
MLRRLCGMNVMMIETRGYESPMSISHVSRLQEGMRHQCPVVM